MIKKYNESPTVIDTVAFDIDTPDANGFFSAQPAYIQKIVITFIERDFTRLNTEAAELVSHNPVLEEQVRQARLVVQADPSAVNVERLEMAKTRLAAAGVTHSYYYKDAKVIFTHGSAQKPLWIASEPHNAVTHVIRDKFGHEQFGRFEYRWDAKGQREGDYFITWHWAMHEDGPVLSAHNMFRLGSVPGNDSYLETRHTPPDKYDILLDRYMPQMYKYKIREDDRTPSVLGRLNKCIAQGFTDLEEMANQLMDIYDANTTQETILPLLANFFNLDLKTTDVTLWRRQIKRAIGLFKAKGTFKGLREALEQAGIKLVKVTPLWQLTSQYVWSDAFVVSPDAEQRFLSGDEPIRVDFSQVLGRLSRIPHDQQVREVKIRAVDKRDYISVPPAAIHLVDSLDNDKPLVLWDVTALSQPVYLYAGDVVLVTYEVQPVSSERTPLEDYIQSLPLADDRDESAQQYPPKNWNVHLLEEDDPLFDVLVPERDPFVDQVTFGKIRTTFMYSEKVYNMDAFDGTLRDSTAPCDIDKDFVDTCSYCRSGRFNVDLEIEGLSTERIEEARSIIEEYCPFDARLFNMHISGAVQDFLLPPEDLTNMMVHVVNRDVVGSEPSNDYREAINQQEDISYEIVWADGSKETGKI